MQQGVVRKPMPLYVRFEHYNNHNEHEYDPYLITPEGKVVIDKTWWQSLPKFVQFKILPVVGDVEFTDHIDVPHALCPANPALTAIYWAYLEGFDYQQWYSSDIPNGPKDVVLIQLSKEEKKSLCAGKIEAMTALNQKLEQVCSSSKEYFVRLSGTSGKNEKPVRPFKTAADIIEHLTRVDLFRTREYEREKDTFVVLIPWNDAIDPRCEFRIFVVNNKLTAASPQRYWEHHQHSSEELEAFETALNNIAFIGKVPYQTFVADVYIDVATATCHLIELNPFGAHCGAGASFFNWIDDYNVLYGLDGAPPQLRYLSAINY
jgi:hypothetical protein